MREAKFKRKTKETQIEIAINLDGEGNSKVSTSIPFFDHMLTLFSRHGFFDLEIFAKGDIEVDFHHTVEDIGICLGETLKKALGDKAGIKRYGWAIVPMDESLSLVSIDISGRPHLIYRADLPREKVGGFDTELVPVFFHALTVHSGITLHINLFYGENMHHAIESIFKAFAKALSMAVSKEKREKGIPSTKGVL